jgi:trans-aconitate methyltransferase
MEFATAIQLIEKAIVKSSEPQHWADLGAGRGLFTRALAPLLPPQSSILAVDKSEIALNSIDVNFNGISIQKETADFTTFTFKKNYDGILLANSLHYVREAVGFLINLKNNLNTSGRLVLIEYDRSEPNAWVPYPIPFKKLRSMGIQAGFTSVTSLHAVPSAYDRVMIYSAVLVK